MPIRDMSGHPEPLATWVDAVDAAACVDQASAMARPDHRVALATAYGTFGHDGGLNAYPRAIGGLCGCLPSDGDAPGGGGAGGLGRLDAGVAAEAGGPVMQVAQSVAVWRGGSDADAVVAHLHDELAVSDR